MLSNIDVAAKKAAEKMAGIDKKIAAAKARHKDQDIDR